MYKSHITAWGLRKNLRVIEAQAILRRKQALDAMGVTYMFLIRGLPADMEDVERCCKRAKSSASNKGDEYALPRGVECVILRQRAQAIKDPDSFNHLRSFFHHSVVHVEGSLDNGSWRLASDKSRLVCCTAKEAHLIERCIQDFKSASRCFNQGKSHLGGAFARQAFSKLPEMLIVAYEGTVEVLLSLLSMMQDRGQNDLKQITITALVGIASITFCPTHPFRQILDSLAIVAVEDVNPLYEVYQAYRIDLNTRKPGFNHWSNALNKTVGSFQEIQRDLSRVSEQSGQLSTTTLTIQSRYSIRLGIASRWVEAEQLLRGFVEKSDKAKVSAFRIESRWLLGDAQEHLGSYEAAKKSWMDALKLSQVVDSVSNVWRLRILRGLVWVCGEIGNTQEAKTYRCLEAELLQGILDEDQRQLRFDGIEVPRRTSHDEQVSPDPPAWR